MPRPDAIGTTAGGSMTGRPAAAPPRRLIAVVACHGRRDVTLCCLARLLPQDGPDLAVSAVLVDDGSPDDTAAAVRARFPGVTILSGDGSLFWAGAMRLGIDHAIAGRPDFILWLNDDVVLDADALTRLIAAADDAGGGAVVAGAVRDPADGRVTYGGQRRTGWHPFRLSGIGEAGRETDCDTAQGNVLLVPAAVAARLGGIEPAFSGVQGMADTDYGLRARAAGFRLLQAGGSVGSCALNDSPAPWRDGSRRLWPRLASVVGPRGFPPRAWLKLTRRHGGPAWPLFFLSVYVTACLGAFRPLPGPRPRRVAFCEGLVPDYRIPFLDALRRAEDVRTTIFVGQDRPGVTVPNSSRLGVIEPRHGRNRYWLPGGSKLAWSAGSLAAVLGRYDVVLASFHLLEASVWFLVVCRHLLGRPRLVLSGHFSGRQGRGPLRRAARGVLARSADALLLYTPQGARDCLAAGVSADRVFVTFNSVDIDAVRAVPTAPGAIERLRRQLRVTAQTSVFLFVGRLTPERRLDLAIAAADRLHRSGLEICLLLIGDGAAAGSLRTAAAAADCVRFLPATYDEQALAPAFALARAVVVPSAIGLLAVNAFAHDRPVIACPGSSDNAPEAGYLEDGVNAVTVATLDVDSFAAAMRRFVEDHTLTERLAAGARGTADRLGVPNMVRATLAGLRRAVATGP